MKAGGQVYVKNRIQWVLLLRGKGVTLQPVTFI